MSGLEDMTLLVITTSYPTQDLSVATELFVKHQVDELKRCFRRVIVISPTLGSLRLLRKDKLCKNYSYDNVEVHYPRCYYIPLVWLSRVLIDNRLRVVKRLIEDLDLDFDIIHAHFTWPSGYIAVKLKEALGRPVVITIHENSDWFDKEVSMDSPYIISAWSGADALIRVNRKDVPILRRYNERACSIPNGFPPSFHPIPMSVARERLGLPQDLRIIYSLGALIKRKGFEHLISAVERIYEQRSDVLCIIGGSGPERRRLQRQIGRLGLEDRVRLIGQVPGEDLVTWMNACDLFVLPSLSESFGVVQIEAMACGRPVVSTRNRGSEEVIESEEHGLLAEAADPDDLAERILTALDRDWDRDAILQHVKRYEWGSVARDVVSVYSRVLR